MKKIWQKSLASMVSAALCLTAFVGCLTVNAATTYNGKITSDGVAVETTATEATVKLTISADVDMAAAGITVSTRFGALTNVSVPTGNEVLYKIDPPADGGFNLANGTVIVEAKDQKDYPFNNAEVTLTFTKNKELTLNENDSFAVNVTPLKNSTIPAATYNEDEIYFDVDNINITVTSATTDPVIDTNIKRSASILVRDKFGLSIGIKRDAVEAYQSFYMEIKSKHYKTVGGNMYTLAEETDLYTYVPNGESVPDGYTAQVEATTSLIRFEYTNITAYEMSLPVEIVVYCLNDGKVVAKSETFTHSIAERSLVKIASSADSGKPVYMDLVNYGAAVQTYFANSYPTSDLAVSGTLPNSEFSAYTSFATSDDLASSAMAVDESKTTKYNGATVNMATNLIVDSNNQLKYTLDPSTYDQSQMKFVISYVNSYGADKSVTLKISDMVPSGKYYTYVYDLVALYDANVTITANVYEGDTLLATRVYSFEDFVAKNVSNSAINPVGDAMMKLNYSARQTLFG